MKKFNIWCEEQEINEGFFDAIKGLFVNADPYKVQPNDKIAQSIDIFARSVGIASQQIPVHSPLWLDLFYLVSSFNGGNNKAITRAQLEPVWKTIEQNKNPMHIATPLGIMKRAGNQKYSSTQDVLELENEVRRQKGMNQVNNDGREIPGSAQANVNTTNQNTQQNVPPSNQASTNNNFSIKNQKGGSELLKSLGNLRHTLVTNGKSSPESIALFDKLLRTLSS